MELIKIASEFGFDPDKSPEPIGSGHINETYIVHDKRSGRKGILQKINTLVFRFPKTLMSNLEIILKQLGNPSYPYETFKIIPTLSQKHYLDAPSGFWRMLTFIDGNEMVISPKNPARTEAVARGYGDFLKCVNQLNPESLKETIPAFHNPESRFNQFIESVDSAVKDRLDNARALIDHAMAFSSITVSYSKTCNELPLRIAHGDTKASNILADSKGNNIVGIIDFDTVMPGYIMNDFGDMVRSMCNTGAEDEKDLGNVNLDIDNFYGITNGLLQSIHEMITQEELDSLLVGVQAILFEQFLRFLRDYLNGDIYYHVSYPGHNLDRAKVHLKLLMEFQSKQERFTNTINKCLANL